jgi:hypothetical protein
MLAKGTIHLKAITIFGYCIPIMREKGDKPPLLGADVRVNAKQPLTGTVTSTNWCGLRVTIASDPKSPPKSAFAKLTPAATARKLPTFTTVWRWKVRIVEK